MKKAFVLCLILNFTSAFAQTTSKELSFAKQCPKADTKATIAAVGDILPHTGLQEQSYKSKLGFFSLFHKVAPWLQKADVAYANLEGPTAKGVAKGGKLVKDPGPVLDNKVYTGTNFVFNYHPRIIGDLAVSGFDLISLANNHTFDRASIGVDLTVDAFREQQMPYVGILRSDELQTPRHTLTQVNGINIAWISCSEHLNGQKDKHGQVLRCGENSATIHSLIQNLAKDTSVDAIIVTPHWGDEYIHKANKKQRKLAREFLEAGASAIIGSHPHVLQEVEKYVTADNRETLIAYSLGNFIAGQGNMKKLSAILYMGLSKREGQKAWVNGVTYLPVWTDRGPHTVNLLEDSTQAPKKEALKLIRSLIDPTRELSSKGEVTPDFDCVN